MKTCARCGRRMTKAMFPNRKFARTCYDCIQVDRMNRHLSLVRIGRHTDKESVRNVMWRRAATVVDTACRAVGLPCDHRLYALSAAALRRIAKALQPYTLDEHLALHFMSESSGLSSCRVQAIDNERPYCHAGRIAFGTGGAVQDAVAVMATESEDAA